jgi:hypothetical protein
MKNLLIIFIFMPVISFAANSWSPETPQRVEGYTRDDGTHVDTYYRSYPHQNDYNVNYGHKPSSELNNKTESFNHHSQLNKSTNRLN